mmetsp:Transcript_26390/g.36454  ORF Transcript_26390/g.36454 Transcript_26390/m.36454 type:complete len:91 (+) Transcript_26390:101-373(+)
MHAFRTIIYIKLRQSKQNTTSYLRIPACWSFAILSFNSAMDIVALDALALLPMGTARLVPLGKLTLAEMGASLAELIFFDSVIDDLSNSL